jgi:[acyl-carrier-protein] S-malonyltransferase
MAVVNNIDVAAPSDATSIRDALYRQAYGPVRWVEVVQALKARGHLTVIECGPGKVLSGMIKRIDADLKSTCVCDPASLAEGKALA